MGIELFAARALKKDPSIKGINVGQKEIKITQYAVSGLEINTSKTEAMWLGIPGKTAQKNPSVSSCQMILFSPLNILYLRFRAR